MHLGNADESLAWSYRIAKLLGYSGLKPTLLMIGKETGMLNDNNAVMEPDNKNRQLVPGRTWSYGWRLKQQPEEFLLVILVNRWQALSIETVKQILKASKYKIVSNQANESEKLDLATIDQDLRKLVDGSASFRFSTQTGVSSCDVSPL